MRLTHRFLRFVHRDRPAEPPAREPTTLVPPSKPKLEPAVPPAAGPSGPARSRTDSASSPGLEDEAVPAGPSVDAPALEPKYPTSAGRPPTGPVELVPARTGPSGPVSDAEAVLPGEVEGKPRPRSKRKRHGRKR